MKLKELRKHLNFTQEKVAELLGMQKQTYQNYELGKREPDIQTLIKLANFYHTSIDNIVDRETDTINLNALETKKAKLIKSIIDCSDKQIELIISYVEVLNEK